MGSKPWQDPDVLYELHAEKNLPHGEIADKLGCSRPTIHKWVNKFDIKPRYKDEAVLGRMIDNGLTYEEMADELNCGYQTVLRWVQKHDLNSGRGCHSHKQRSGRAHFTHATAHGYERSTCTMSKDVVKIHRLLAVAEYGFDAVCDKVVHHENGIPWDHRPENITPMADAEHKRLHNQEKLGIQAE